MAVRLKALMQASPPKNQPKPGRPPVPDAPMPATRPRPRSGLSMARVSRAILAHSKARSSSGAGVFTFRVARRRRRKWSAVFWYSACGSCSSVPVRRDDLLARARSAGQGDGDELPGHGRGLRDLDAELAGRVGQHVGGRVGDARSPGAAHQGVAPPGRLGDHVGLEVLVPVGVLAADARRPHGLEHRQEAADDGERLVAAHVQEDQGAGLVHRHEVDCPHGEGLVDERQDLALGPGLGEAGDVPRRDRAGCRPAAGTTARNSAPASAARPRPPPCRPRCRSARSGGRRGRRARPAGPGGRWPARRRAPAGTPAPGRPGRRPPQLAKRISPRSAIRFMRHLLFIGSCYQAIFQVLSIRSLIGNH